MQRVVEWLWYQNKYIGILLLPLAMIFWVVSYCRRHFLQGKAQQLALPIVVVGNISVGGTGKTPLIIALVKLLQQQGYKPAVISRGYGGKAQYPYLLHAQSSATESGDEPLLIFQRCQCPVVVSPKRMDAAQFVIQHCDADIILSDDGLQHYALPRDIEIVVIDGVRGFGNGLCLPAGPLRELPSRLKQVDFVVVNGKSNQQFAQQTYHFAVQAGDLQPLHNHTQPIQQTVHAVAAIGNPARFFDTLRTLGYQVEIHSFPDHYVFKPSDLLFDDGKPVIMTEKDAVKCRDFMQLTNHWYLPISAVLPPLFQQHFLQCVQQKVKK